MKKKSTKTLQDPSLPPQIMVDAYKAEKKTIKSFTIVSPGIAAVVLTDVLHVRWLALDAWTIHEYSKDWALAGRTVLHYANQI